MKKFAFLLLLAAATPAAAQSGAMPGMDMSHMDTSHGDMTGMDMPGMSMNGALGAYPMSREASGTSWQPQAAPQTGIMLMTDGWMTMLQARVTGIADSQSGPRGDSQIFSTSMAMAMATRALSDTDTLGLRAMVSLDPLMGRRGYPLLLASGETANGVTPLVDRQHPHDLFMELAATYSHQLSDAASVFLYAGYPGEPALGPTAYMHRISAEDIPATPIAHHWLDATHVTFGVATAGCVYDAWKMEVSQFTGREPDQHRFDFDKARFDSTSARLSWNPDDHWSLQTSWGFLKSPEQLEPALNEIRLTASATYFNTFDFGSVAATLAFGNKHLSNRVSESAVLLETEYKPSDPWTIFGRAETIGSDELAVVPKVRHAGELTLGAIHDWPLAAHLKFGLGGLYEFYATPADAGPTKAGYGGGAYGAMGFVRLVAE